VQANKLTLYSNWAGLIISGSKTNVTGSLNVSPSKDQNGLTPSEALEHQLNNNILVQNQATKYITPSSPFLYLGVTLTMDLNWKHQHRRMNESLEQKLDALEGSCASPRQTLNIIRTAIIRSLAYAFAVTPCSYPDLDKWDAMIGRVIKSKHNLWRSTLTAMIREDVHSFGLGAPSIYVEYHRRSAVALVTSLEDPFERHQSVTVHLLTHQVAQLKALATTFLFTREGTSLPIKRQLNLHMRARQLACIHASKLQIALKGNSMFIDDLKLRSHLRPQATPPTLATLINCITKPLMDLGITGFHDLTSANEKYIVSGKQLRNKYTRVFKKHIIALNRLAAIANLPGTQEPSPTSIAKLLRERNSEQSIQLIYRKLNNSSFTGLLDTHINISAHEEMPPNPTTPKPNKLCPSTQHLHHSHAQQHTTGTPLQTT
jgi:hypothetical protein